MSALAFSSGVRAAFRAIGLRAPIVLAALAFLLLGGVAAIARVSSPLGAPDAILAPAFALALPLMTFALMHRAARGLRLAESVWPIGRHGVSRRYAALGVVSGAMITASLAFAPALLAALAIAYGRTPGLARDALTSGWIAVLGACVYTAWFGFGSSFWRNGRGRWLLLGLDFVLGGGTGVISAAFPRAHLASLLGEHAVIELSQKSSCALLAIGALLLCTLAALRVPD